MKIEWLVAMAFDYIKKTMTFSLKKVAYLSREAAGEDVGPKKEAGPHRTLVVPRRKGWKSKAHHRPRPSLFCNVEVPKCSACPCSG